MLLQMRPAPGAGSEAEPPHENPRHVALIGEAARRSGAGEAPAVANQAARARGALLQDVGVRRQAVRAHESPQDLISAQARYRGKLGERRRIEQIVGQALAHSAHVRGSFARCRQGAVARQDERAGIDQRFFTGERVAARHAAKETLRASQQLRIADDRMRDFRLRARGRGDDVGLGVHDAPAPRRAAERPAVVDLAGIGGDEIAGVGVDAAASARGAMRAALEKPEAVRIVPVPREVLAAFDAGTVDAFPSRGHDLDAMHHRKLTSAIQLRLRRASRSAVASPSKSAAARLSIFLSMLSSAFTLTTAYTRPSIVLVTSGTMPQRLQMWKSAVRVPKVYLETREGSWIVTSSAPFGFEVHTPPCFVQNEQPQARAGICAGSGSQVSENAMFPQWHLPRISTPCACFSS